MSEKDAAISPDVRDVEVSSEVSMGTLRKRVLRLATFQRGYTFKQQTIKERKSWTDDDDEIQIHKSKVSCAVKWSYGAPQFCVLALYMLLAVHATLLFEYLGAPLSYLAFFTALARSMDVFTDPVMSWISDSSRSRFGRRIPFMVGGCGIYAGATILLLGAGVFNPPTQNASCVANGTDTATNQTSFVIDGDGSTQNVMMAYWYGATFIFFYIADTICNVPYNALAPELSDSSKERENVYFVQNVFGMLGTMIGAVSPPLLESAGLSKELSFFVTGSIFAGYYVLSTFNLAKNVGERTEGFLDTMAIPLVPSTVRSFSNPGFRILLISWFIDAVGWYSLAAVLPFYVKYYLQPGKAGVSWMTDEIFLGIALSVLFISAIAGMPFWKFMARKFGRYRAWLAYNLWNGVSNALYILVQPQDYKLAIVVTVLNGIPFGGKFLSDSNLSDCIDYDEFLSGDRREAQYTMFASFIPKIVSIPSQALPLAVISSLGFLPSETVCNSNGETEIQVAEQPDAVRIAIQIIFAFFPVITNLISFGVKTRYPFVHQRQIEMVSAGIGLHSKGFPAEDPITGEIVKSQVELTEEENLMGVDFDFFFKGEKRTLLLNGGSTGGLIMSLITSLVTVGVIFGGSLYGVVKTFYLLEDSALSWVPSFLQIVAGLSAMVWVFNFLRLRHAYKLRSKPFPKKFMQKWIAKSEGGGNFDDLLSPLLSNPALLMERLTEDDSDDDEDSDSDSDEDAGTEVSDRRAQFKRNAIPKDHHHRHHRNETRSKGAKSEPHLRPPNHGAYAGSTRNFVVHDEAEKEKILQSILSGRRLI